MTAPTLNPLLLALLISGAALADGLPMQVDEPAHHAAPPIDPGLEGGHWKSKPSSPALNRLQRAAMEDRRKKVEEMATRIREKREAVENSGIGDKAARVKDLESLVLETDKDQEKDQVGIAGDSQDRRIRFENRLEKRKAAQEKALERKRDKLEKKLEKSLEKQREKLDKAKKSRKEKEHP